MSSVSVVVADTTPLNYLVVIGHAEILASLFGEVWIPEAVLDELRHPKAPEAVNDWLKAPPSWLRVTSAKYVDETIGLGRGETEAISLALEWQLKVVLMDERRGRAAAEARGLVAVGTLNLIELADGQGLLDGVQALEELKRTTFRAESQLLARFEARMRSRRG
jgi:predicted nucleic acid-binding protein